MLYSFILNKFSFAGNQAERAGCELSKGGVVIARCIFLHKGVPQQRFTARVAQFFDFSIVSDEILLIVRNNNVLASARIEGNNVRIGDSFHLRFTVYKNINRV